MRLLALFLCLLLLCIPWGCESSATQRRQLQTQHSHTTEEALHSEDAEGADSKHKEPKETIAEVLEEALKHEFHAEEEKKVLDEGKKFNETAKSAEVGAPAGRGQCSAVAAAACFSTLAVTAAGVPRYDCRR